MKTCLLSFLFCLALSANPAFADTLPKGGKTIIAPHPTPGNNDGMNFSGKDASMQIVPKEGGGYAYRITVNKPGNRRWDVQLNTVIPSAIRQDHVYMVRYDARCIESMNQEGTAHANVEKNGPPHSKTMSRAVDFGTQWTTINLPFVVRKGFAFDAGGSVFTLHLGSAMQVIELANIQLIDFGDQIDINTLPKTKATYPGIAADAPWRKEAAKRIDQYRKANLQIQVVDSQNKPVNNAKVHIAQQRHAFGFGTAMNIRYMNSGDANIPAYEKALLDRFNTVVFENGLKWFAMDRHTNEQAVAKGIKFVKDNDLYMRGHVLVWPSKRHVPKPIGQMIDTLKANPDDQATREKLRKAVEHRINWITRDMAGKLDDWDVVNETYANHDIMDVLDPQGTPHGKGVMVDWFKLAHQGDPNAKLFLNDYGILTSGNHWNTHQQYFYETLKDLKESGAPIHGIGMQSHFGASLTAPTRLWEILDHYSQLGLPIKVTEFDINLDDDDIKAEYTRDFYTAIFAHPNVEALLSWGFWAGRHWRPEAAYLDMQFKSRPNDIAMRKLLFEDWWTNTTVNTNHAGKINQRIFKGRHVITVTWPDGSTTS
ncbi:MAG: endo-1,4-beta-xylanase, partial [Phycisphaeraceae bacterium JB051]